MLLHTALGYERADNYFEDDALQMPEDSEDLEVVPASSSPVSSSPFLETPPDNAYVDPNTHVDPNMPPERHTYVSCLSKLVWDPQATALAVGNVVHTTTTDPPGSNSFGWTKESQGQTLSVSDCELTERMDDSLACEGLNSPSGHPGFASRLHELLLVAQREQLARRTASSSACVDDIADASSSNRVVTPPVNPLNSAGDGADSPDYWSYFPESTAVALSRDDGSLDTSSASDSTSSAYNHSGNYASEIDGSNSAYVHSSPPSVDPSLIKTTTCTPVLSGKRSLLSAHSSTPADHISFDLDPSLADQEEPKRKRIKREDEGDLLDVDATHSKDFPPKPSLEIATKKRSMEDVDAESAGFLPKRRMYAHRAASLRRADSLRSEAASSTRESSQVEPKLGSDIPSLVKEETSEDEALASDWVADIPYSYVPTEPATPVAAGARVARRRALPGPSPTPPRSPMPVPLPIVAPPPFSEIPSAPLSEEDAAERRIKVLVKRETEERSADGLADLTKGARDSAATADEIALKVKRQGTSDEGEEREHRIILRQRGRSLSVDGTSEPVQSEFALAEEPGLCIDENIRTECIDWILEVLPDVSANPPCVRQQLHAQLQDSHETRWHAAQLFTRYFYRLACARSCTASPANTLNEYPLTEEALIAHEGREVVTWDCAVACVTLSVKFHRDVFLPNYMIPAREFGALAPHTMTFDDLETAQRDVFDALSHSLGSATPGQYLQDFWLALPSLRTLLAFDEGWKNTQEETWAILLEAFMQTDILRFPTSLITACALIDGCVDVLIERYKVTLHAPRVGSSKRRPSTGAGNLMRKNRDADLRKKATQAVQGVKMDLQELLGYSEADVRYCRFWLRSSP